MLLKHPAQCPDVERASTQADVRVPSSQACGLQPHPPEHTYTGLGKLFDHLHHLKRSASLFRKGPDSKYFRLCGPDSLCRNSSALP